MHLPLFWIDAFSDRPFSGNPAAVVPLEGWLPDSVMQRIAFENGLAETAFYVPLALDAGEPRGRRRFHLRWFTPAVEVDLCGHATLATGHVILRELGIGSDTVTFESRSGPLTVTLKGDKLELDFPATPVTPGTDPSVITAIEHALGAKPTWVGRSRFDHFAVLPDAATVRALKPDMRQVAALGARGLIVSADGEGSCDFVSRFFAPQSGIPEDPVTGSAHCALAPYWAGRLGRNTLHALQVSPRGGELWCEVVSGHGADPAAARVRIAGHATLYLRGQITLPSLTAARPALAVG